MRFNQIIVLGFTACLTTGLFAEAGKNHERNLRSWTVVQLIDGTEGKPMAMIDAGIGDGIIEGMTLTSFRPPVRKAHASPSEAKVEVETGVLKVTEVRDSFILAEIHEQGSFLSKSLYPKFPGVMSGDHVVVKQISIVAHAVALPEVTLPYGQLFADPKAAPSHFELTASGREQLERMIEPFLEKRLSLIMIEGHTDHHGLAEANQIESYQRALTIRQYLIDNLGFDPKRLVAVGYGESELADRSMVDGHVENNRRIVIKAAQ